MIFTEGLAKGAVAITPSDTARFNASKGLYIAETADVKVELSSGDVITFVGLAGGAIHPISVSRVYATGTTATGILVVR